MLNSPVARTLLSICRMPWVNRIAVKIARTVEPALFLPLLGTVVTELAQAL